MLKPYVTKRVYLYRKPELRVRRIAYRRCKDSRNVGNEVLGSL